MIIRAPRKMYSYIRKPFSANGWPGFFIALVSFAATQAIVIMAVRDPGSVGTAMAAAGVCCVMFALSAAVFAVTALADKKSNRFFAAAALIIACAVIGEWAYILVYR